MPPAHMKKLEEIATKARFTMLHTVANGTHNVSFAVGFSLDPQHNSFSFFRREISRRLF